MIPDLTRAAWRKSSHSGGNGGECVELARTPTVAAVRDSKNPAGAVLVFEDGGLGEFLTAVKRGRFAR
ncbi:DUF397 domain-containing protein [Solihabitans fulvus]|uniref:DUF397 domain-containing protein n=1 Tax=Solihabitans fulvus TaxID=1892852 RepID=A0A5B2WR99_9PSEU|nr:DUF397 domain-containing protein [Solihabitans fulvus]KAA2253330.1 DUF397 domain-containing protein [Solihabitans fulvus]